MTDVNPPKISVILAAAEGVDVERPEMTLDLEVRPEAILLTLDDGRSLMIEHIGGALRALGYNDHSESPAVMSIPEIGAIETDLRDHLDNTYDVEPG
jgi:hypothetical protein